MYKFETPIDRINFFTDELKKSKSQTNINSLIIAIRKQIFLLLSDFVNVEIKQFEDRNFSYIDSYGYETPLRLIKITRINHCEITFDCIETEFDHHLTIYAYLDLSGKYANKYDIPNLSNEQLLNLYYSLKNQQND